MHLGKGHAEAPCLTPGSENLAIDPPAFETADLMSRWALAPV